MTQTPFNTQETISTFSAICAALRIEKTTSIAKELAASWCNTPLGPLLILAEANAICAVEFFDRKNLITNLRRCVTGSACSILEKETPIIMALKEELHAYFAGELHQFTTPIIFNATPFISSVWHALQTIPLGHTVSYADLAAQLHNAKAYRAVALANSKNPLVIIVPCHRVIGKDGSLSGYAARIDRKEWLLNHEKNMKASV